MGNLITDYNEDNDKRDDVVIDVPPAPPVQPVEEESFSLPEASPEAQQLMSDPGNPLMDMKASDMPDFTMEAPAPVQHEEIITPDFTAIEGLQETGGLSAVEQFNAGQEEKEKKGFLAELDTNSLQFLTSGDVFPSLYEGAGNSEISQLNRRALELSNQSYEASKRQQTVDLTKPMPQSRVDLAKPGFNSTQNPLKNIPGMMGSVLQQAGDFLGITNTSNEFDPLAGVQPYAESIIKDPWKIISLPLAPVIITSQGKFGEQGDGLFGGTVYALSLPENIVMGGLTDLHNLVTGNKNPKTNMPNIAQAIIGGNFDFTQRATDARPLSFIGSSKAPKTLTELRNRNGLNKLLLNDWTFEVVRRAKVAATGNENINIPDLKYVDPRDNKLYTVPAGKAMQGFEAGLAFTTDVLKGAGSDLIFGAFRGLGKAVNAPKKVTQALPPAQPSVVKINPQPIPYNAGLPPAKPGLKQVQVVDITNQPVQREAVRVLTPAVKNPTRAGDIPDLEVFIRPNTRAPKPQGMPVITPRQLAPAKDVDEIIQEISKAPIGTTVDIDSLVRVERSAEELTEVAKLLGDVTPTRIKPLSRARLDELSKLYDPALNPYKIHGSPIDIEAFRQPQKIIEIEPGQIAELADDVATTSAVDIPLPKDTTSVVRELHQRQLILQNGVYVPEVSQQIIHEIDILQDAIFDVPDVSDTAKLAEVLRILPSSYVTTTPTGVRQLQDMLSLRTAFEEAAEAEQVLKPIVVNAQKYLSEALDELDTLPELGRTSALKAEPFEPSPVPDEIDIPLVREDYPNASDDEFNALLQAQSLARTMDNENLRTIYKSRKQELLSRRSDAEIIADSAPTPIDTPTDISKKSSANVGKSPVSFPVDKNKYPDLYEPREPKPNMYNLTEDKEEYLKMLFDLNAAGDYKEIVPISEVRKLFPNVPRDKFDEWETRLSSISNTRYMEVDSYGKVTEEQKLGGRKFRNGENGEAFIDLRDPKVQYKVLFSEHNPDKYLNPNGVKVDVNTVKEEMLNILKDKDHFQVYELREKLDGTPFAEIKKALDELEKENKIELVSTLANNFTDKQFHNGGYINERSGLLGFVIGDESVTSTGSKNLVNDYIGIDEAAAEASKLKNQAGNNANVIDDLTNGGGRGKKKKTIPLDVNEFVQRELVGSREELEQIVENLRNHGFKKQADQIKITDDLEYYKNDFDDDDLFGGGDDLFDDTPEIDAPTTKPNVDNVPSVSPPNASASKPVDTKNLDDFEKSVVDMVESRNDELVPIYEIAEKFPNLSKKELWKRIYKLEGEDILDTHGVLETYRFTDKQLAYADRISDKSLYFFVSSKKFGETKYYDDFSPNPKPEPVTTYYHGSQVRGLDLTAIDPLKGGSRNELGVGIYLTTNKELAENSAKAMPQNNLPPLAGREFDEIGEVFEVTPQTRNAIDAKAVPNKTVHENFMQAVRQTQPEDVYKSLRRKLGKEPKHPYNTYYTSLDEVMYKKLGTVNEVDALQTQRVIQDGLRVAGFDAIDDGDILVLLGGSPNNSIGNITTTGKLGNGSTLEGYAARYNVAQITAAKYPKNKVLEVQAKEAGVQLQTELTKNAMDLYEDSVTSAEDIASAFAKAQDELENTVKSEKKLKAERKQRTAAQKNKNQIDNDSKPDTNHCI